MPTAPLLSKYVTLDEYKAFYPMEDLQELLGDDCNASLYRNEVFMATIINGICHQNIDLVYPQLTDYQKQEYKYALIEQEHYRIHNGEIETDSGYDQATMKVTPNNVMWSKTLCKMARLHLNNAGIWTGKLRSYGLGGTMFFNGGLF